jgi:hypothetical protein
MLNHVIWVRDQCKDVRGPARAILYAIASRCDSLGRCWPSVRTIAKDSGLSPSTVSKHLPILPITIAPGSRHNSSVYRLAVHK